MPTGIKTKRIFACVGIGLLALALSQLTCHSHALGQDHTNCHTCQASDLHFLSADGFRSFLSALMACGHVSPFIPSLHQEILLSDFFSRAPPLV